MTLQLHQLDSVAEQVMEGPQEDDKEGNRTVDVRSYAGRSPGAAPAHTASPSPGVQFYRGGSVGKERKEKSDEFFEPHPPRSGAPLSSSPLVSADVAANDAGRRSCADRRHETRTQSPCTDSSVVEDPFSEVCFV